MPTFMDETHRMVYIHTFRCDRCNARVRVCSLYKSTPRVPRRWHMISGNVYGCSRKCRDALTAPVAALDALDSGKRGT